MTSPAQSASVSVDTYPSDRYYPKVVKAFDEILSREIVVAPVDVFMAMGLLSKEGYEDWRFGRIPDLEKAIQCGLPKCKRILKIIGFHAHDLDMVPRPTVYMKWGKGKKIRLCFSKNRYAYLEKQYEKCFKWNRRLTYSEWKKQAGPDAKRATENFKVNENS